MGGRRDPAAQDAEERAEKERLENAGHTLEKENDLRQFLKVVRPDWSQPRRHGHSDIHRVMKKLKTIGVMDIAELMRRVLTNRINEDLTTAGYSRFSRETIDGIKKQTTFLRALEHLNEASVRQNGRFAPVPQLLSAKTLHSVRHQARGPVGPSSMMQRPGSEPSSSERKERRDHDPLRSANSLASLPRPSTVSTPGHRDDHDDFVLDTQRSGYSTQQLFYDDDLYAPGMDRHSRHTESFGQPMRLRHGTAEYDPRCASRGSANASVSSSHSLPSLSREGPQTCWSPRPASSLAAGYSTFSAFSSTTANSVQGIKGTCRSEELTAHLQAMQQASKRGSEQFDRLAQRGEEDLDLLNQDEPFSAQGGNSLQIMRIAASYTKLGLNPKRVLSLLLDDSKTVGQVRHSLDLVAAERMHKVGQYMHASKRDARWKTLKSTGETLQNHGQQVILEQAALDDKAKLEKQMKLEGTVSPLVSDTPMRRHVTNNIRHRLQDERERDSAVRMEVQQQFINIKRQLTMMANAKRELGIMQRKIQECESQGDPAEKKDLGLTLAFGKGQGPIA